MKSFGKVALVGVSGVVLFKVGTGLVLPILGLVIGLVSLAVKVAVVVAIGYFVMEWLKKDKKTSDVGTHDDDIEVDIDVEDVEIEIE